jgi:hypothetical protein
MITSKYRGSIVFNNPHLLGIIELASFQLHPLGKSCRTGSVSSQIPVRHAKTIAAADDVLPKWQSAAPLRLRARALPGVPASNVSINLNCAAFNKPFKFEDAALIMRPARQRR